jgi:hypothetical protein
MAFGCATSNTETLTTGHQGLAEIRVDAAPFSDVNITRVTVETAGESQDLVLNPSTGTFDGTLILPSGAQILTVSAYTGEALVGQSRPTPLDVQPNLVTRVMVRILDLTPSAPPIYGPIVDSLSYPTTTEAGALATFTMSVVAPAGDPVTYAWTSDCPGSTFSAPQAATTGWSTAAQGACTINVVATSHGFTVAQSFAIVVFPAGSGSGAVEVSSTFVTAPAMMLMLPDVTCSVSRGGNASCPTAIASPATTGLRLSIFHWGSSAPGSFALSDSCGGRFGTSWRNVDNVSGAWLPPVAGGLCILTARAINGDGLAETLSAAILVRAGVPATAQPPRIFASLDTGCSLGDSSSPPGCGQIQAGSHVALYGNVSWADGLPGALAIIDDCVGTQPTPDDANFFNVGWDLPSTPGRTCTTSVRATNLQGVSSEVAARYQLGDPGTPPTSPAVTRR